MKKYFFTSLFSALSYQYVEVLSALPLSYWLHYTQKPFVFRALIPLLGESPLGILVVTLLFGIGLGLAMLYAYKRYWVQSLRNDASLILSFGLFTMIITRYSNYYDYASAFFMLVMLLLWMEKKDLVLVPVFALASLNRETAILIIPVLLIIRRSWFIVLYTAMFVAVRFLIVYAYGDMTGQAMYFQLEKNISVHLNSIIPTIILFVTSAGLMFLFFKKMMKTRPEFVLYTIIVLPCLTIVYFVVGYAFEIRVFAEALPLLFMSAFMENK